MHRQRNIYQSCTLDLLRNCLSDGQDGGCKQRGQTATFWLKALLMPRLTVCSRDLHWHWINWTLLCDTIEVSMLRLAWLPIVQHVFQPALTGRLALISRKIVSSEQEQLKAIAVSRFREKLSPANWMQGVTKISRKILRSWAPRLQNSLNRWVKKWGPTCNRDISNSAIYTTAIYRAYTVMGISILEWHLPVCMVRLSSNPQWVNTLLFTDFHWYWLEINNNKKKRIDQKYLCQT